LYALLPDDGWKYHPKHVEQFPDINKMCNVASCWIYIGILLGAHPVLHISRIRVNRLKQSKMKHFGATLSTTKLAELGRTVPKSPL
jgi:hypothetical protein